MLAKSPLCYAVKKRPQNCCSSPNVIKTSVSVRARRLERGTLSPVRITEERLEWKSSGSVRFEISTAVTMKNDVFWDVTPCGSCKKNFARSVRRLLATANVVPSSPIFHTLMMKNISFSEPSVLK
jgi:hypothetical protein